MFKQRNNLFKQWNGGPMNTLNVIFISKTRIPISIIEKSIEEKFL